VTCGEDTTSPADVARGRVNLVIGFAPLRPGEFATVSIAIKAGQSLD
jgi:phage tail sheath protein FI